MKYLVSWDPDAFRSLLRSWIAAGKPESAVGAFDEVEQILGTDADAQGEGRDGQRRILIVPPLGVIFQTNPETAEVLILDAWLIKGPSREATS